MKAHDRINFGKAYELLMIIKEAGQHGPMFQKLVGAAQAELRDMLDENPKGPVEVTLPSGQPAIQHPDGTIEEVRPVQPPQGGPPYQPPRPEIYGTNPGAPRVIPSQPNEPVEPTNPPPGQMDIDRRV